MTDHAGPTLVERTEYDGFEAVRLQNEFVTVVAVSDVGCKVVQLTHRATGTEWLPAASSPLRPLASYDDPWHVYDRSGWDELVPSVGEGFYSQTPWDGTRMRDHGELWHRPWRWQSTNGGMVASITGLRFPYRFSRTLSLNGPTISVGYEVENLTDAPFTYSWAMHPLLRARPGTRLLIPADSSWTLDASLNTPSRYRSTHRWPFVERNGNRVDLSVLGGSDPPVAAKLFSARGSVERAAVVDPSGAWLGMRIDPDEVPHVGLWINEGVWPEEAPLWHVGLEPTNGTADEPSIDRRLAPNVLSGFHSRRWGVTLELGPSEETAEVFVGA